MLYVPSLHSTRVVGVGAAVVLGGVEVLGGTARTAAADAEGRVDVLRGVADGLLELLPAAGPA